jgi:tyrosine-protein phosphatase SIW14
MELCARAVRAYGGLALLLLALAIPAIADSGHAAALEHIRIANFGRISESYFRGSQPVGRDFADLAAVGIKTVIDLQQWGDPAEPAAARVAGLRYVNIPMTTRVNPTQAQIDQFLAIVSDPAMQPVYVHCAGGHHRTGIMTALYRMHQDGWTGAEAFAEMKKFWFGRDDAHPEFKEFVLAYKTPQTAPGGILNVVARAATSPP